MERSALRDLKWVALSTVLVAVIAFLWKPDEWIGITILALFAYLLMSFGPRLQASRHPDDGA